MRKIGLHLLMTFLALAMIFPLAWMVVSSLKPSQAILAHPLALPEVWSLDPFKKAWVEGEFSRYFTNSLIVTGSALLGVLFCGSLAGFALARLNLPGSKAMQGMLVVGLLLPVEGILIPLFKLNESLHITESRLGLILPYMALELPIAVFLFRAFFLQIPKELEEAARIDGCGVWGLYWRIFLPMGTQVMGVVSILTFLAFWNEFLLANFLLSDEGLKTMPAAFNNFYGRHRVNYQLVFAGLTVYIIPAVIFYLVMSRAITKSVTAGAVKG